jgi:hypothetical protein
VWVLSCTRTKWAECRDDVGSIPTGDVAARDTKAKGSGPVLGFTAEAWSAFVADIKAGHLTA